MFRRLVFAGLGLLALVGFAVAPARAAVQVVNVSGFSFSPQNVTIARGDSIKWVWGSGLHTTTSGNPNTCVPNAIWDAPIDQGHPSFTMPFAAIGTYTYFCRFHCGMGMNGTIRVVPAKTRVTVQDHFFSPQNVTIVEGDSIEWVWVNGSHTTTSGDPSSCTPDGQWSAPINQLSQTFTRVFPTAGTYTYYCIPHCVMGMNGTITVGRLAGAPDAPAAATLGEGALNAAPNPLHSATTISFRLADAQAVTLEIYDAGGHRVATLARGELAAGVHTFAWDGRTAAGGAAPSGVYFARSRTAHALASTPLVLVR